MKHLPQRVAALLLAAVMSLTLTGCMFRSSVEDLFTMPRVSAEYEGLSQELDDLQKQGYERALTEQAQQDRSRTNAANAADDAARRCNLDNNCRMRPDAYQRD